MGIDYSLCLVAKREDSHVLLGHLCELLDARSRARITSRIWSPESEELRATLIGMLELDSRGIAGIEPAEYESPNSYCLSLQIQIEQELESLVSNHNLQCFEQPGSFGCMWTSVFAGSKYLLLEMTAATSGMSLILQQSEAIHSRWRDLARKVNAIFAYVDLELRVALQLFPCDGNLELPDPATLAFDGDVRFSVDRLVSFLIATNHSADNGRRTESFFHCTRCGQLVTLFGEQIVSEHPEIAAGVCAKCGMRERAAQLPKADVEAIRKAANGGVLPALKVAQERLGWSLSEAVLLVHVLSGDE